MKMTAKQREVATKAARREAKRRSPVGYEVARLDATGMTSTDIARRLNVSTYSVLAHLFWVRKGRYSSCNF